LRNPSLKSSAADLPALPDTNISGKIVPIDDLVHRRATDAQKRCRFGNVKQKFLRRFHIPPPFVPLPFLLAASNSARCTV